MTWKIRYILFISLLCFSCKILAARDIEIERADSLKNAGNYIEALTIFRNLLESDIAAGNRANQCADYNNIANVYCRMGSYEKSTSYYFSALKLAQELNDRSSEASINYGIGMNFVTMHQDSLAIEYIEKAAVLFKALKTSDIRLGYCFNILGYIHGNKSEYLKSFSYFKMAEDILKTANSTEDLANVYVTIGDMKLKQGDYEGVKDYTRKALILFEEIDDARGISTSYINLAAAHYSIHEHSASAYYKKEMHKCISLLDSATTALKDLDSPEHYIIIYGNKAELYGYAGNFESAYYYLRKHDAIKDSVYAIATQNQIRELNTRYDTERKEQDILLLKEQNNTTTATAEKRKLWIITISAFTLIMLLGSLLIITANRSRKKQKELEFNKIKAELEQTALRAQMNPHFIFNALNSIQHYILNKETEYAYDYLAKFGKLIRQILINSEENSIALNKEIETLKLYIELEQRRFKNRFDFEITIPDDFPADEISIPTMLIQPFVENAIWHGIMNLDKSIKGKLKLGFDFTNNTLHIVIEDNGIGRKEAAVRKINNEYKSVGVLFSQKRLELLEAITNQKAQISIEDLEDTNGKSSGTKVEITIAMKA